MPDVTIDSSYDGGDDDGSAGNYDSTGRLNLESYQRAQVRSWGEVIRTYVRRSDAKAMFSWYFPSGGYDDVTRAPVGTMKPAAWFGAHWESTHHDGNHKHISMETPDSTGALQTRFEIVIGDQAVNGAIAGLDKTRILTNQADLVVRTSNGQVLRLQAPGGTEKAIEFGNTVDGGEARWKIRATGEAETGSDAGTNLQIARCDDTGAVVDSPVVINRATGKTSLTGGLDVSRAGGNSLQVYPQIPNGQGAYVEGLTSSTRAYQATVAGDAVYRFAVGADGRVDWGNGTAARDTNLYRAATNVLKTDSVLSVGSGVVRLTSTTSPPATGPAMYVEGGALKFIGASGTVTTLAPA